MYWSAFADYGNPVHALTCSASNGSGITHEVIPPVPIYRVNRHGWELRNEVWIYLPS
jgi:hypothetical protein